VASLEAHEPPYPELFRVTAAAANAISNARRRGGRVVAVGTTVVRALETVAAPDGTVSAGEGWTDLVITPDRGVRAIDSLLTGFHEPRASHLAMLEALASRPHLETVYAAALDEGYLWHEFGDLHLIAPLGR
jgi:S-adenosylmethionine:tRNA ribosyltransferase-isomerase